MPAYQDYVKAKAELRNRIAMIIDGFADYDGA